ncbi:MAG: hypothetical protein IPH06_00050 [Alphaproteobacteria bacterium]|nr:hypothetical protein [Alphaproteobacteria bacterium]
MNAQGPAPIRADARAEIQSTALYGYKVQKELDYAGSSALRFERTYRSNGDWLNFNLGKYWRHNYDRTITLVSGPQSKAVEITTGEGTAYKFRLGCRR